MTVREMDLCLMFFSSLCEKEPFLLYFFTHLISMPKAILLILKTVIIFTYSFCVEEFCMLQHMCGGQGELLFFFYHVVPGDETQVLRFYPAVSTSAG